jgi:hypothetical protein
MKRFRNRIAIMAASLALAAGTAHASSFHEQVAADPRGEVDISNISGSIVISGWDRPEVLVTADLPGDTQRVKVMTGGGHTRVCVAYGDSNECNSTGWHGETGSVRLEIRYHFPRRLRHPTTAYGERRYRCRARVGK